MLATLRKNFRTDLHEVFRKSWQRANEQTVKFWWRSRTDSPDGGTDIATLVRRALAEVCTVPVLLVLYATNNFHVVLCPLTPGPDNANATLHSSASNTAKVNNNEITMTTGTMLGRLALRSMLTGIVAIVRSIVYCTLEHHRGVCKSRRLTTLALSRVATRYGRLSTKVLNILACIGRNPTMHGTSEFLVVT